MVQVHAIDVHRPLLPFIDSVYEMTLPCLCILVLVLTTITEPPSNPNDGYGLNNEGPGNLNLPTTVTLESTITAVSESTTTLLVYFFLSVFRAPRFNSPWGLKPFFDPPSCHIGSATSMLL